MSSDEAAAINVIRQRWSRYGGMGNERSEADYTDEGCRTLARAAFNDIPGLLAEIDRLRAERDDLAKERWAVVATRNAAVARAEAAEAKVAAVAALHHPYDCTAAGRAGHESCGGREWCYTCPEEMGWPCSTVAALSSAVPVPTQEQQAQQEEKR
jgi:hypothetical protein